MTSGADHSARLSQLRRRFIAANMRSRALRLTRMTRAGALDLARVEAAFPEAFERLLGRLGHEGGAAIPFIPVRPQDPDRLALADDLTQLLRAARASWMETGAQDLYVGWPLLEGRSHDGTWLRGPLLLYPVAFETTAVGLQRYNAALQGPPELNVGLAQAIFRLTRVRLTLDALLERDRDRVLAVDATTWADLHAALEALGVAIDPAGAGALPALSPIPDRDRGARDSGPRDRFALHHHLVLGRFPSSGSNIILDYDQLLEVEAGGDLGLAAALMAVDEAADWEADAPLEDQPAPLSAHAARRLDDSRRWQVLSSDSSQDAVFQFLSQPEAAGLVVQGPPGTGKSQMITNLIASCIADGRRALLVCQKRAALDVVADRLASVGLREPVAVVHDVQRDRNAVCDAIADTLDRAQSQVSPAAEALEAALQRAERDCDVAQSRLDARLGAAQEAFLALAFHPDRPALAELQERALDDDLRPLPDLVHVAGEATERQALALRPRIAALSHDTRALAAPHPLHRRARWADGQGLPDDLRAIFGQVRQALDLLREMERRGPALSPEVADGHREDWARAAGLLDLIGGPEKERVDDFLLFWTWTGGQTQHGEWAQVMGILRHARRSLRKVPHELVSASRKEVEGWLRDLSRLRELSSKWYRFLMPEYWRLSKTPRAVLDRCASLAAEAGSSALVAPAPLCEMALRWHDLIAALPSDNTALSFGFQGDPSEIDDAIADLRAQHDRVEALHELHAALRHHGGPYAELPDLDAIPHPAQAPFFAAALGDRARAGLLGSLDALLAAMSGRWEATLLDEIRRAASEGDMARARAPLEAILGVEADAPEAARLDGQMRGDPWWMQRFLRLWRPPEAGLADPAEDAQLALERAWRALTKAGRSSAALEAPLVDPAQLRAFGEDLDRVLGVGGRGVLALYHRRLAQAAAERGRGRALRKLAGEARKKRHRMTLRQIVEHHWDTGLSQARPVWFCSPDAVAALFPMRPDLFDLVIFDEASQCPVESAVPTLARTRRAVVAGDDQQMPPSHFFQASDDDEDDEEESAVLASHSLLALARVAFADTTLRWHYRSRHEALVAFSNAAFYGGRLITAPRRDAIRAPMIEGLHFERVGGLWADQRNEVEARAVVKLVGGLLSATGPEGGPPSIGVVTFNRKQAELIEGLLEADPALREALARDRERPAVEQLFVRNLENVQGDERAVIIFSVGYGPTTPGGRVHARFGPLGQAGGEKRLNVAITRAKLGVWVLASFDPDQLDVASSTHRGPKLFKLYLQYVKASGARRTGELPAMLEAAGALGEGRGVTGAHRMLQDAPRVGGRVRDELAEALLARGLRVQRGLGLGSQRLDLAVGAPGEDHWRLGVDCSEFLASPDPMARDIYTPRFWNRLGWRLIRVTPSMWLNDRQAVVVRVLKALAEPA